jgi:hypothetical protein
MSLCCFVKYQSEFFEPGCRRLCPTVGKCVTPSMQSICSSTSVVQVWHNKWARDCIMISNLDHDAWSVIMLCRSQLGPHSANTASSVTTYSIKLSAPCVVTRLILMSPAWKTALHQRCSNPVDFARKRASFISMARTFEQRD